MCKRCEKRAEEMQHYLNGLCRVEDSEQVIMEAIESYLKNAMPITLQLSYQAVTEDGEYYRAPLLLECGYAGAKNRRRIIMTVTESVKNKFKADAKFMVDREGMTSFSLMKGLELAKTRLLTMKGHVEGIDQLEEQLGASLLDIMFLVEAEKRKQADGGLASAQPKNAAFEAAHPEFATAQGEGMPKQEWFEDISDTVPTPAPQSYPYHPTFRTLKDALDADGQALDNHGNVVGIEYDPAYQKLHLLVTNVKYPLEIPADMGVLLDFPDKQTLREILDNNSDLISAEVNWTN